eukprot:SAG11_NODE_1974_length_3976_cov_1.663915_3_plen_393_part_00
MGQGLNTKVAQIAAQAFGIETSAVHVSSTDSDKVPNNPPTAASYGADLNGMAVLNACQIINARLEPVCDEPHSAATMKACAIVCDAADAPTNPTTTERGQPHSPMSCPKQCTIGSASKAAILSRSSTVLSVAASDTLDWSCLQLRQRMIKEKRKKQLGRKQLEKPDTFADLCHAAYFERISLMAEGFYASPHGAEYRFDLETDDNSERGDIWNYFAFGVGCAEVEVDCLTGVWRCVRSDLVMDVGNTLNAALDVGQVEGAFIQGMGLCTTEELIWVGRSVALSRIRIYSAPSYHALLSFLRLTPTRIPQGDKYHPWLKQDGKLHNAGPAYKCPAAIDVPEDLRLHLLRQSKNPYAVHSSKAVGEPPTFLGGMPHTGPHLCNSAALVTRSCGA